MAAEAKTRTIGGIDYQVSQLMWGEANQVFGRLLRTVGPAFGAVASGSVSDLLNRDVNLGEAMQSLAQNFTADDIVAIRDVMLGNNTVQMRGGKGYVLLKGDAWDAHFTGKYFDSLKLLAFCLEVNFGDFLAGIRSAVVAQGLVHEVPASSSSDSPSASTGSSGGSSPQ